MRPEVLDVGGRRVTTLEERWLPGDTHAPRWDGADAAGDPVAPGVYLRAIALRQAA